VTGPDAIRITDPARVGAALADLRTKLGITRRQLARDLAARTGRSFSSWNSQLWSWEVVRSPNPASVAPVLAELGWQLALVPLDHDGPETSLSATESAEPPNPGVLGCAGVNLEAPGASEAVAPGDLADVLAVVDGPALRDATVPLDGDSSGGWNWIPTADGGFYSGPHGPDICPAMGCRHEGGAA
jgi:hypothetical protein